LGTVWPNRIEVAVTPGAVTPGADDPLAAELLLLLEQAAASSADAANNASDAVRVVRPDVLTLTVRCDICRPLYQVYPLPIASIAVQSLS
jgi:hypothetical protein